jgi:hypothetical protein
MREVSHPPAEQQSLIRRRISLILGREVPGQPRVREHQALQVVQEVPPRQGRRRQVVQVDAVLRREIGFDQDRLC